MIINAKQRRNLKALRDTGGWTRITELYSTHSGMIPMAENGLVDIRVSITDKGLKAIEDKQ